MVIALTSQPYCPRIAVRRWSELEFAAGRSAWQSLLRRSAANPLFMSWEWQSRWWRTHHAVLSGELCLLAAYTDDGRLVGLAPLYRHEAAHRWGPRALRLQLLGSTFRGSAPLTFSEYLDFIVDTACEATVMQAFIAHLRADSEWSDLVVAQTPVQGLIARAACTELAPAAYLRWQDGLTAHVLRLPEQFEDYLHALKPGIRRKVWNRRGRLSAPALVFAHDGEFEGTLQQIQRFQAARWGGQAQCEGGLGFHAGFAAAMARQGALRMSVLVHGGEPISALYNVELDGTQYNLKSGFSPAAAALSPSYLHFGYCLEEASRRGVRGFDFLAGDGRSRDYKQDFGAAEVPLVTLQVIRNPRLQRLYRLYDGAPGWVRRLGRIKWPRA